MAHGMSAWRAGAITIPSGTDVGTITRLLSAPAEAALRVVQLSGWGAGGSARFAAFLIPPAQGTAGIYAVVAGEPIYAVTGHFATNGMTQVAPQVVVGIMNDFTTNPVITIPAGWSMGIQPTLSTTGATQIRAVAVIV